MTGFRLAVAAVAAVALAPASFAAPAQPASRATVEAAVAGNRLQLLDPTIFAPANAFAPPPAAGSEIEKLEFARLRALIAAATPERMARAAWDGDHEEPAAFSKAAGHDLTRLPATSALLATISDEVERMI